MSNHLKKFSSAYKKFFFLFFLLSACFYINADAQDSKQRIISTVPKHIPIKVEIINGDMNSRLEDAKIKITNTSAKPIYFLSFNLKTFENIEGKKVGFSPIQYGNKNLGDFTKSSSEMVQERGDSEFLSTGDVFEFKLNGTEIESFKNFLLKKNYLKEPRLEFSFYILSFGDSTGFMTATGVPYPPVEEEKKNNNSSIQPLFFLNLNYIKSESEKPPTCGMFSNVFKNSHLKENRFSLLNSILACPCGPNGSGCGLIRPDIGGQPCCTYGEPHYVNSWEVPSGCGGNPQGYICGYEVGNPVTCPPDPENPEGPTKYCNNYEIVSCDGETTNCVDEDGDGYFKISPSCPIGTDCNDDPSDGGANMNPGEDEVCDDGGARDENCDGAANCASTECRLETKTNCDEICDKDLDGHYDANNPQCRGDDCVDDPAQNPRAFEIHPGPNRESTEEYCESEDDEDCDNKNNCADSSCRTPTNYCPNCDQVETSCDPNSGDEDCDLAFNCADSDCQGNPLCAPATPTPSPDGTPGGGDGNGDGEQCPCNDCVYGCDDGGGGDNCTWIEVPGQCYAGVCYYSPYGYMICEPPSCDPPTTEWMCF